MKVSATILAIMLSGLVALWNAQSLSPLPQAWVKTGPGANDYDAGLDWVTQKSGVGAKTLRGDAEASAMATVMQSIRAENYHSAQVRFSALVHASQVTGWGGLWMQIETQDGRVMALDNMQVRPIRGELTWTRQDVILNVPSHAAYIRFGLHLTGPGQIWMDDIQFERVINLDSTAEAGDSKDFVTTATEPKL